MELPLSMPRTGGVGGRRRPFPLEIFTSKRRHEPDLSHFPLLIYQSGGLTTLSLTNSAAQKGNRLKVLAYHRKVVPTVDTRSVEEMYDALTERLLQNMEIECDPNMKYIVGLVGPPGAGKTTIVSEVVRRLNMTWCQRASRMDSEKFSYDIAIAVPMDGFHLYRSQLDAMEDPKEAHARRGAPWTFDPVLLLKCLQTLKTQGEAYFPSFDHGVGDPVENDILVNQHHKVVIVEGCYLLLEDGAWKEISSIFNEKWFIEIDINKAMQRVVKRHISTGKPRDVAQWRIEYNDRPNAELIVESKKNADVVIKSVDVKN